MRKKTPFLCFLPAYVSNFLVVTGYVVWAYVKLDASVTSKNAK